MYELILSIFPGIDLLGRAFELEGFCVVRGPDLLFGGDIREFHPPINKFTGIIGGSPCQDFSRLKRNKSGYGYEMLLEFCRVVKEAAPDWFLLENVATVPDIHIEGYSIQRFDLNANECGLLQSRLRHFQFGSRLGLVLIPDRQNRLINTDKICLASEGRRSNRRDFNYFCQLMGLPANFNLPGFTIAQKYAAVGNGVPIPMGRTVAKAIRNAIEMPKQARLCACGCGRIINGKRFSATPACRKRIERRKKRDRSSIDTNQQVTTRMKSNNVTLVNSDLPGMSHSLSDTLVIELKM